MVEVIILIEKLRSNYKLSNVLIRLALVLSYILYSWQSSLGVAAVIVGQMTAVPVTGTYALFVALITSALIGVLIMFLTPLISQLFLNYSHFYSVPRAEYRLLTMAFFTL